MANDTERIPLLGHQGDDQVRQLDQTSSSMAKDPEATAEEAKMGDTAVGERLKYNDYTTIDWLHDLVKDSNRMRFIHSRKGTRYRLLAMFDDATGWIVAALIGTLTACVAYLVDVAEATVSDWKLGYCKRNPLLNFDSCCEAASSHSLAGSFSLITTTDEATCEAFQKWSSSYAPSFAIYVAFALAFGIISSSATMLTKRSLPAASPGTGDKDQYNGSPAPIATGKTMYMAAGSGIPEIKTILSGFVIPNFLDFKVLFVKGFGAVFAVATGMCLGKEGPFVHISTCVGYLVANRFAKYRNNGRKMREMLSVACAAGLSVAFGAPIGGVLFSYEEISTYFPRRVLWRAFLCSLFAAVVLKMLDPTGTGRLVLFETHYGASYNLSHYLVFVLLGIVGGLFGGAFCRLNYLWSKWFRSFALIKNNPVLEVALVVLATTLMQYPNPLTRDPNDVLISNLFVDCRNQAPASLSYICHRESEPSQRTTYLLLLAAGTLTKLLLTIITFGTKVPSGVIIPALAAGALFGRFTSLVIPSTLAPPPGLAALVGAAAFLAGVSRMTISLCAIMFELTGELDATLPHMVAILVAKWTADSMGRQSVYDLAQSVLGHPFLDHESALGAVQKLGVRAEELIPPARTMEEITVVVPLSGCVKRGLLEEKRAQLEARGLLDAGLVLVRERKGSEAKDLQGYIAQGELVYGLASVESEEGLDGEVKVLGGIDGDGFDNGAAATADISAFVDRTPVSVCAQAPMEYVVEMFGKLGLRYLMVTEEGSGALVGVVIKKRLVAYLDGVEEE